MSFRNNLLTGTSTARISTPSSTTALKSTFLPTWATQASAKIKPQPLISSSRQLASLPKTNPSQASGQVLASNTIRNFFASPFAHYLPSTAKPMYDYSWMTDDATPISQAQLNDVTNNGPELQALINGSFRGDSPDIQQIRLRNFYRESPGPTYLTQHPNALKPQGMLPDEPAPTPTRNFNLPGYSGAAIAAMIALGTLLSIMGGGI